MISHSEEAKTTISSLSNHPATFFHNELSLKEIIADKLLADNSACIEKISEFILRMSDSTDAKEELIENVIRPRLVQLTKRLGTLVAQDNQVDAKAMLEIYPGLMFIELDCKNAVEDKHGRILIGSSIQIAQAAQNIKMLEIMESIIQKSNSNAVVKLAHAETVHENKPLNDSKEDKPYSFDDLIAAINAEQFVNGTINKKTEHELNQFKAHFNPKNKVYKLERHFDFYALSTAVNEYMRWIECWGPDHRSLFKDHVIGYLKSFLPTCHAQTFDPLLDYLLDQTKPFPIIDADILNIHHNFLISIMRDVGLLPENPNFRACGDMIVRKSHNIVEKIAELNQRLTTPKMLRGISLLLTSGLSSIISYVGQAGRNPR